MALFIGVVAMWSGKFLAITSVFIGCIFIFESVLGLKKLKRYES